MKTVTVVEMQTRLCELLAQQETEVTQVTYQGKPVVAVLPLERYQALLTQVTYQGKPVVAVLTRERYQAPISDQPAIEVAREAITQAQRLFHSYRNWLAPRLQGQEHLTPIIEVTRRKRPVGALLAWNDWQRFSAPTQAEEPILNDFVLPITAARNHLLKFPDQFAREEQTGHIAHPVTVIKQEEPLLVIVSWQWFQSVTNALHALVEPDEAIRRILADAPPRGKRQGEILPGNEVIEKALLFSRENNECSLPPTEEQERVLVLLTDGLNALLYHLEELPEVLGNAEDILVDAAAMTLLQTALENITAQIKQMQDTLPQMVLRSKHREYGKGKRQ